MNSLKGIFDNQKPPKKNFILENMKQLRTMRKVSDRVVSVDPAPRNVNKYSHVTAKISTHLNSNLRKGSSAVDIVSRNGYITHSNGASSEVLRGLPHQFSTNQQLLRKSVIAKKAAEGETPIPSMYNNNNINNGRNASEKCDKQSSHLSVPLIRSTSPMGGSSQYLGQGDRLCTSECENLDTESSCLPICSESVRSLGCQTVPPDDLDCILNEGVIKYPSTWNFRLPPMELKKQSKNSRPTTRDSSLQTEIQSDRILQVSQHANSKISPPKKVISPNEDTNCRSLQNMCHSNLEKVLNEEQIDEKLQRVIGNHKRFPRNHWNGDLPWDKERPESGENSLSGIENGLDDGRQCCHDDRIPLSEVERAETLRMLRKSYEEHIRELNLLPVKTDTLKMRQRKIDLERQLNKLEEGIKIFSRPKVYVKMRL